YKVVRVDPTKKLVALTFDDGPDPYGTPVVLETLEKYKAKGTFFMLGSRVKEYPDLAVRIRDEGHELGNHSWSHPLLTRISADKVAQEINSTVDIIEQTTGQKPTVFRPPYGGFNQTVVDQLKGIPVIMWEVDTNDWKYRSEARLLEEVKKQVHDRSIILMHDIHKTTADGLDAVIQYLKDEDYHFVTTTEMLDVIAYDKENKDTK
ncbi:MAG TPA: polysaccharide deacetylase family protein, partial [Savagea sp.]